MPSQSRTSDVFATTEAGPRGVAVRGKLSPRRSGLQILTRRRGAGSLTYAAAALSFLFGEAVAVVIISPRVGLSAESTCVGWSLASRTRGRPPE